MNYGLGIFSKLPFNIFESCKYSVMEHIWQIDSKNIKILLKKNGFQILTSKKYFSSFIPINSIIIAEKN